MNLGKKKIKTKKIFFNYCLSFIWTYQIPVYDDNPLNFKKKKRKTKKIWKKKEEINQLSLDLYLESIMLQTQSSVLHCHQLYTN